MIDPLIREVANFPRRVLVTWPVMVNDDILYTVTFVTIEYTLVEQYIDIVRATIATAIHQTVFDGLNIIIVGVRQILLQ